MRIQIFDRQQRRVRLTATSRRFIEQAERLTTLRDRIVTELRPEADYVGTIRIGVAETVVHTLLPNISCCNTCIVYSDESI